MLKKKIHEAVLVNFSSGVSICPNKGLQSALGPTPANGAGNPSSGSDCKLRLSVAIGSRPISLLVYSGYSSTIRRVPTVHEQSFITPSLQIGKSLA